MGGGPIIAISRKSEATVIFGQVYYMQIKREIFSKEKVKLQISLGFYQWWKNLSLQKGGLRGDSFGIPNSPQWIV